MFNEYSVISLVCGALFIICIILCLIYFKQDFLYCEKLKDEKLKDEKNKTSNLNQPLIII
tara:strand:+ start:228 stop:407 length:180 start_codon:yes stop_codon:yes gene_type:complete